MMTFQPVWVSIFSAPVIVRLMHFYAETARAKRKPGTVIFSASSLAMLCLICVVFAFCIVIGGWRQGAGAVTAPIGFALAAFSLWLWPSTIVLDDKWLNARHLWKPTRSILYSEIEYVSRMEDRKAVVYGKGKVREINISEFHVGDDELEAELRRRGVKYYKPVVVPLGGGIR